MLHNTENEILEEFTSDYDKRVYGREISKKLNINQKTVSNILNRLEKEDILKFSIEGKNKYYYLNKFSKNIKDIMKITEINKKIKFLEKNKKIKDLFIKIEERTEGACLIFGSYARGTNTKNSDLDVLILGKISDTDDLEDIYNIKINIIKSSKEKFDKKEHLVKEIIQNHIILKGVEDFIDLTFQKSL